MKAVMPLSLIVMSRSSNAHTVFVERVRPEKVCVLLAFMSIMYAVDVLHVATQMNAADPSVLARSSRGSKEQVFEV